MQWNRQSVLLNLFVHQELVHFLAILHISSKNGQTWYQSKDKQP